MKKIWISLSVLLLLSLSLAVKASDRITLLDVFGNAKLKGQQCIDITNHKYFSGTYCVIYKGPVENQ